ncbi:MAG: ChrR family anti-sigma-E factor [Rhodobiaceae bacterium]|nr:ChrR family anti-sigma-E factor [Rhodobiaceae bacterium]
MPPVTHHVPDDILQAYASGALPHPFALVVAAHLSLCEECRATSEAFDTLGGAALEAFTPVAADSALRARTMAALDNPVGSKPAVPRPSGIYPSPVMAELGGAPPRWRSLGAGIRQTILSSGREGSARLLYIPGGKAVPDHGHNGLELTLVLQGSFHDHTGRFGPGDIQVVDTDLDHVPTADDGPPCICLAATDAPLRFNAFLPRLLQRAFRI